MVKFSIVFFVISQLLMIETYAQNDYLNLLNQQIKKHQPLSGVMILDTGEDALITRAWLADNAQHSIDVQYFIWSSDNIGVLAAESLLRAAERGVTVRVIVDDLLIDVADNILLALAAHPNVSIRIYNPQHSVGTTLFERMGHAIKNFRSFNQRMHDKTFTVDSIISITGGRNMADEYFDYNQSYNFRDRDVLIAGHGVKAVKQSFNLFWNNELSQPVKQRFADDPQLLAMSTYESPDVKELYGELHQYASSEENFEPEIRTAIHSLSNKIPRFIDQLIWADIEFISDKPGKNDQQKSFSAGSHSARVLAAEIVKAKTSIVIQSPYLILSNEAKKLFYDALERGVEIIVSTNSLQSTDNLQAYSGYKNQKEELIKKGIKIFEYKAFPSSQKQLMQRFIQQKKQNPIFAIHAKSMVIDSKTSFIGTYNLDPRSQNLNTETIVKINDVVIAAALEQLIKTDIQAENSWRAEDNEDENTSLLKRLQVFFWQIMPIKPLL